MPGPSRCPATRSRVRVAVRSTVRASTGCCRSESRRLLEPARGPNPSRTTKPQVGSDPQGATSGRRWQSAWNAARQRGPTVAERIDAGPDHRMRTPGLNGPQGSIRSPSTRSPASGCHRARPCPTSRSAWVLGLGCLSSGCSVGTGRAGSVDRAGSARWTGTARIAGRSPTGGAPQRGQRPKRSASAWTTVAQQKPQTDMSACGRPGRFVIAGLPLASTVPRPGEPDRGAPKSRAEWS
jgi:hypothetical protein